jgi:DNA-binding GntR family transcriptional regulator
MIRRVQGTPEFAPPVAQPRGPRRPANRDERPGRAETIAGGLESMNQTLSGDVHLKPIRLTDQVVDAIKQRIFNGLLRPGQRVVEQKLARQFGVGQNAVREALIELAHLGFVRRVPNKGTYVTEIRYEDGVKIARVRQALEGLVLELIAERMRKEQLDFTPAANLLKLMRRQLKQGDIEAFYASDIEFHRTLWRMAGNEILFQMLELIVVPLFAFFIMVNLHPDEKMESILEAVSAHERILEAIQSGSAEKSKACMSELLNFSLRFSAEGPRPRKRAGTAAAV